MPTTFDTVKAFADLEAAHNKGDNASAKRIADSIRANEAATSAAISGGAATEPGIESLAQSPLEGIAEGVSSLFKPSEGKEFDTAESAGAVGGGAASGGLLGATAPALLKGVGKVLPGPVGKGATALGEALSVIPAKERVIRGAASGAAMSGIQEAGNVMGAAPALTFGAGLLGGNLAETGASFLSKEGGNLLKFLGNAAYANVPGMSRAFSGMLDPNKPLNKQTAMMVQEKLFGNKVEGYVDKLVGSENRVAAQEALRKADPDFFAPPVKAPTDTSGLAGAFNPLDQLPRTPKTFAEAKRTAQAAGLQSREALAAATKAETAAAEQTLRPASTQYREKMYEGVTQAVEAGKRFSSTPEFAQFAKNMQVQVALGNVSRSEAEALLKTLSADQMRNPAIMKKYAETVDQRIRKWGRPAEGGQASGAAAVDQAIAKEVRDDLRNAFNTYTSRLGLGDIEKKYRNAYSTEMVAEARDKLPSMLQGFETGESLRRMTKNLMQDPQGTEFIQKAFGQHLAQQAPEKVVSTFEKLQHSLVSAKLLTPTDLRELRAKAEVVQGIADRGHQLRAAERLKQIILMTAGAKLGAATGRQLTGPKVGEAQPQQQ